MYKGYKVRIYPTKAQEELLWSHIHSCRFIWNYMLSIQKQRYLNKEDNLNSFEMTKLITPLKKQKEYEWLNNVSNKSLQLVCRDLNYAFRNFYQSNKNLPKFKSKKFSKKSYPVRTETFWIDEKSFCHIEKIGLVKMKSDFNFGTKKRDDKKFTNVRISYLPNKKWMLSFGQEVEKQDVELNSYSLGIDLGIKETAVIYYNNNYLFFHNINKSAKIKKLDKKITHLQKDINRKYNANKNGNKWIKTNNIARKEQELRLLYYKRKNIINNYNHQMTHKIVTLFPQKIIMENLNVKGMMKNRCLSKAIQQQSFYEIMRQLKYKSEKYGIVFIKADRFFPSSKTCSCCGMVKKDLKLSDRIFKCNNCGFTLDRDLNAAINLANYAI